MIALKQDQCTQDGVVGISPSPLHYLQIYQLHGQTFGSEVFRQKLHRVHNEKHSLYKILYLAID